MPPVPFELAFVPLDSVQHMMALARRLGIKNVLRAWVDEIEEDFKRWEFFDKTPRVAGHSDVGVFELTRTSNGEMYGFKCFVGHPNSTSEVCRPRRRSDCWRMWRPAIRSY